MVVSTTINKYSYITARELPPFFEYKHRIRYFEQEQVNELEEIRHPSVREAAKYVGYARGLEVVHNADLPARSGLGSSSTFTVGILHALRALEGYMPTKRELAKDAIHVEQTLIGESVGSQDQVAAAFGGLNCITFSKSGGFEVEPITISAARTDELLSNLLLCFTGFARTASKIAEAQIANTFANTTTLQEIAKIAGEGLDVLRDKSRDLLELGVLLDRQWQAKRSLSDQVSNSAIDEIYSRALSAGALGGKLLGAGGGGFMLFVAHPNTHKKIVDNLGERMFVPFRFDNTGSSIVYYSHG
jgi:D-glycero-alpha-D-manno-heptose-7-phosphate kinase